MVPMLMAREYANLAILFAVFARMERRLTVKAAIITIFYSKPRV
jgi:hypothetical protein